ncbi:phage protein Gp36 family protein [Magnetococcus sp. PR-3]|uniref:phage protein Gp36 family protein n=1 Tax=Magnetococcus sp. PR-3 TaxID=3120355 RepID=UPI002FCDEFC0
MATHTYCTMDDLTATYDVTLVKQLVGVDDLGELNEARIMSVARQVTAMMDRRLSAVMITPITDPDDDLVAIAVDLTLYRLGSNGAVIPDWLKERHDLAQEALKIMATPVDLDGDGEVDAVGDTVAPTMATTNPSPRW